MICSTGTAGGSLLICDDVTWGDEFVRDASAGALETTTAPGGGGRGPCCCAATGIASTAKASMQSALTPIFLSCFLVKSTMTLLILCGLLARMQSPLYLNIRCTEHGFRGSHPGWREGQKTLRGCLQSRWKKKLRTRGSVRAFFESGIVEHA